MFRNENTTLFIVHEETAEGWARRDPVYYISQTDAQNAERLLLRLKRAKLKYTNVIQFEFGPLEPLVPSTSRFTWQQVVDEIGSASVDVAGLRRSECVSIVFRELSARLGHRVRIKNHLTID